MGLSTAPGWNPRRAGQRIFYRVRKLVSMAFAIGIEHNKSSVNLGTLLRSAGCFGASLVFTVGRRYKRQCSDTLQLTRHVPVLHFTDWQDFRKHQWLDWQLVAIEITEGATPVEKFTHPRSAIYLLGPEDGSISREPMSWPDVQKVYMPSFRCLNVATAGSIVMWHRSTQRGLGK